MSEWQAGRELDAEVARRVFGLHAVVTLGRPHWPEGMLDGHVRTGTDGAGGYTHLRHCSTDIAAAWHIINHFDHGAIAGAAPLPQRIAFWQELARIVEWERNTTWPEALALSDLPLLISRAALIAVEPAS